MKLTISKILKALLCRIFFITDVYPFTSLCFISPCLNFGAFGPLHIWEKSERPLFAKSSDHEFPCNSLCF
jgi:hypothetical protein